MADNITFQTTVATPPSGTVQRTDDLGAAGHVPYAKLMDGTDGASTVIAAGGGVEAGALRVTIASDSTGVLSIDDNGGAITVDGSVSISGTVTVGSHAVTNAGTFVVQVDGAALTALQLIDNLVLAEDAVHGSGDPGVQLLAVRKDTAAALAGADGDYAPLEVDANGCLHVLVNGTVTVGSHAVTNAGTFAVQAAQSGTWNITNVSGTISLPTGAATAAKQPALGTAGTPSADVITVQGVTSMTALKVDGSGVTQPVSGTVTANLAAGTNNIGDVDVLSVPAPLSTTGGGTEATALRVTVASDSTGVLSVDDNGASLTVDGTVSATSAGDVAHDAADSGNPVKVGGKASVGTTPLAPVSADADRANLLVDGAGRVVTTSAPRGQTAHATTTISASTSETTVLAAGAASVFHDIVCVLIANTSATAVRVDFKDATSGTIRFSVYAPAGQQVGFIPAVPVEQATAAANWTATSSASVTDLRIFVQAIKTKG